MCVCERERQTERQRERERDRERKRERGREYGVLCLCKWIRSALRGLHRG